MTLRKIIGAISLPGAMGVAVALSTPVSCTRTTPQVATESVSPTPPPSPEEEIRKELGVYTLTLMDVVESPLSNVMRTIITRSIVDVAMDIFPSQEERKEFIVLISIESKFNPKAKSASGAVGLTQVIPKYAKEFGSMCGMGDVVEEELSYPVVNLLVGACRFKTLLEIFKGQTALALVAYNAGMYSDQIKQLQRLENLKSQETASYVTKWLYLKQKMEKASGPSDKSP